MKPLPLVSIEPSSPLDNSYAELVDNGFRDESMAHEKFENEANARTCASCQCLQYRPRRPYSALGHLTLAGLTLAARLRAASRSALRF